MALAMAPPGRVRPILYLATYAGLRAHDISQLRGEDFWWHQDPPTIFVRDSKGGAQDTVAMAPVLCDVMRTEAPPAGWLLPRLDGTGPIKPHHVSKVANDYLHSLGITETLHTLRHWFGTEVLRASGGNVRVAQEALRHADIKSTMLYTFIDRTEVARAVSSLPVLE